ncbi:MAG: molybdate ABC transporter permease subunit [Pseudomonadota bacterium]
MFLSSGEWQALSLSLQLSATTTVLLLMLGTPLALWLAKSQSVFKTLCESIVALPLVLPPTVLGFYLLIALSPDSLLGQWWQASTGQNLAFSFSALVIGSCIYSLPFVVQPLQQAFSAVPTTLKDASATLGASPWDQFWSLTVPLCRRAFVLAGALGFAHTLGEFGVVLMIGGSIPGETRVLSIALYEYVEVLDYASAHRLSFILLSASLVLLFFLYRNRGWRLGK